MYMYCFCLFFLYPFPSIFIYISISCPFSFIFISIFTSIFYIHFSSHFIYYQFHGFFISIKSKRLTTNQVFNYLFGSLARVFTTIAEVDDPLILYGFLGGAFLNFVLAAQMVWYWNSGKKLGGKGAGSPSKKRYTGPAKGKGAPKRKA